MKLELLISQLLEGHFSFHNVLCPSLMLVPWGFPCLFYHWCSAVHPQGSTTSSLVLSAFLRSSVIATCLGENFCGVYPVVRSGGWGHPVPCNPGSQRKSYLFEVLFFFFPYYFLPLATPLFVLIGHLFIQWDWKWLIKSTLTPETTSSLVYHPSKGGRTKKSEGIIVPFLQNVCTLQTCRDYFSISVSDIWTLRLLRNRNY